MPLPAIVKVTGTGSVIWTPDFFENPFNIGMSVVFSNGTGQVDYSMDNPNAIAAGTTVYSGTGSMNWFNVIPLGAATTTGSLTIPCQALRAFLATASNATSTMTVTFVQATLSPT